MLDGEQYSLRTTIWGRAEVKINPKDSVELPLGEYRFKSLYGDKICGYFVDVKGEGWLMTYIYNIHCKTTYIEKLTI